MSSTNPRVSEDFIVGGQAVVEGVMMRSPHAYAVSVRRPDGTIESISGAVPRLSDAFPMAKLPVIRGAATIVQSLTLGVRALNFSGAVALDESEEEAVEVTAAPAGAPGVANVSVSVPRASARERAKAKGTLGPVLFALVFNVCLFVLVPLALTNAIFALAGGGFAAPEAAGSWYATAWAWARALLHPVEISVGFNLVEGAIRLAIFVTMIALMARLDDMRRVFEYHGAEHKVVMAYETGAGLSVEAARPQPRLHPRCGTSFLMVVMLVAVALFSVVRLDGLLANALVRVALFPLVAGLSYEVIRAAARKQSGVFFRAMVAPGLWLQHITTREPSDDQLEVAVHALRASLALEPSAPANG